MTHMGHCDAGPCCLVKYRFPGLLPVIPWPGGQSGHIDTVSCTSCFPDTYFIRNSFHHNHLILINIIAYHMAKNVGGTLCVNIMTPGYRSGIRVENRLTAAVVCRNKF